MPMIIIGKPTIIVDDANAVIHEHNLKLKKKMIQTLT